MCWASRPSIAGATGKRAPASWGGDPSREIESREFWEVFSVCLSRLPQGLADAFFLRELDDVGAEEVQQTLGITPANFWKRLHRARMLLRQCLESGWFVRSQRTTLAPRKVRGAHEPT